jgi:hypothetical protein
MGAKRVINGVHIVPMGMANAFLIEGDDGLTLIDAGFPSKEAVVDNWPKHRTAQHRDAPTSLSSAIRLRQNATRHPEWHRCAGTSLLLAPSGSAYRNEVRLP